jgi:hypothetical protein
MRKKRRGENIGTAADSKTELNPPHKRMCFNESIEFNKKNAPQQTANQIRVPRDRNNFKVNVSGIIDAYYSSREPRGDQSQTSSALF